MSLYLLMRMQCFSVNDALFRDMKRTVGIVRGVILATFLIQFDSILIFNSKRLNDYIENSCAGTIVQANFFIFFILHLITEFPFHAVYCRFFYASKVSE